MKSFRLDVLSPPTAVISPQRFVTDYSEAEIADIQRKFRSELIRGRRFSYCLIGIIFLTEALIALAIFWNEWIVIPALICGAMLGWASLSQPKLLCPGCGNDIKSHVDHYCPVCGSEGLPPDRWDQAPYCVVCETMVDFYQPQWRDYKIRFCTHCGVPLDKKGV